MLLDRLFQRLIKTGVLALIDSKGRQKIYGHSSPLHTDPITLILRDDSIGRKIALDPDPVLGEAYMQDRIRFKNGRVYDFLDLVGRNLSHPDVQGRPAGISRLLGHLLRRVHQLNPTDQSRKNVAHHYDLTSEFYDLFLDADRQYSCAYFKYPEDSLAGAQYQKKHHLIRKLCLKPDQRVLDIGCGWGGLAIEIAKTYPRIQVTGITLSEEQLRHAREKAFQAGVSNRVHFELRDYRHMNAKEGGHFDRILSVGMFEHVGVPHYPTYFAKIKDLLTPEGIAVVHAIGRSAMPGITSPFIRKYIFPGGYIPAISEVMPSIEKSGLWLTDMEILRLHYADTLRHWRERFLQNWQQASALYDSRFCRMWEFYLAGSEMSFRHDQMMVFQIQLSHSLGAVPLTRDYQYVSHSQEV